MSVDSELHLRGVQGAKRWWYRVSLCVSVEKQNLKIRIWIDLVHDRVSRTDRRS